MFIKTLRKHTVLVVLFAFSVQAESRHSSQLEKLGITQEMQKSISESYAELERIDNSLLQRHQNIEAHQEVLIMMNEPEYKKLGERDITDKLVSAIAGELKISNSRAKELLDGKDPRAMSIYKDFSKKSYDAIFKIAQKRVQERDRKNMSICIQTNKILRGISSSRVQSEWQEEVMKGLGTTAEEAKKMIKTDDPKITKYLDDVLRRQEEVAYKKAKLTVLRKQIEEENNKKVSR